jgi:alanyl-tRNA synthetase
MRWATDRIRQSFLDFFKSKRHTIVPSAPLVPQGDPTLLFTNAGMVQFKDYFLGVRTPPFRRVANCQKCLRISGKHNDLEAVGRDTHHHTFFEMLGNWSFGDYYKREAIEFHWELLTRVWEIAPDLLWATVYRDDAEAEQAWRELGVIPRERILRFGDEDNFWQMGETGPCGPCSEIHIDRGKAACDRGTHRALECGVNVGGCSRFIELANLVFIQYDRDASGKLTPLPMKCVDTGTGLERVTAVLQSFETGELLGNYDIDVFRAIIEKIEGVAGVVGNRPKYGQSPTTDISFRAIADHVRAISFLLAEGIVPGNVDRGYVLRRLIRRAARHGRRLGINEPFLESVCGCVIQTMSWAYPELHAQAIRIGEQVDLEEKRFAETLDRGLGLLDETRENLRRQGHGVLPGEIAFKLSDTYGFPLDLTEDILRDDGMGVDVAGFNRLMKEQRERARAAREEKAVAPELIIPRDAQSRFVGYRDLEVQSEIVANHAEAADRIAIATAETPFYPESGGQVGDCGVIEVDGDASIEVNDTRKGDGSIVHLGRIVRGDPRQFEPGRRVTLKVDRGRREAAMLNHSATHLLHWALRDRLGQSVRQAGSLVAPDRLRFDFNHRGPVSEGELVTIEDEVNARIRENAEVVSEEMAYDDAIKSGALAFFGDKYGDRVRVIRIGDFSVELCGGTHVRRTGEIGLFKLEGESGIAAGVRRIEATTGRGALKSVRGDEKLLEELEARLGAGGPAAVERLQKLLAREKELGKRLRATEQRLLAGAGAPGLSAERVRECDGIKVVTRKVEGVEAKALGEIADQLKRKHGSAVIAVGSDLGDRVALVVAVTPDLSAKIRANELIKGIAPLVGGSGGGRADFAQAGGHDRDKLDEALERVAALIA